VVTLPESAAREVVVTVVAATVVVIAAAAMAAETRGMTYFQDNFKIYYNITVNNANSD
jgi:hypothetical protein